MRSPTNTRFLERAYPSQHSTRHSLWLWPTDTHTQTQCYVCSNRPHHCIACTHCRLITAQLTINEVSPRGRRNDMPPPMVVRQWHIACVFLFLYFFFVYAAIEIFRWIKLIIISFRRQSGHHGFKNRGGSTSVRGRVRSPRISGGRRWLSCRQSACI